MRGEGNGGSLLGGVDICINFFRDELDLIRLWERDGTT